MTNPNLTAIFDFCLFW